MKKLVGLGLVSFTALAATGCGKKYDLKISNWDDYIDLDIVEEFTKDTGIKVLVDTVDSNEAMKAKSSEYDILIPSEYTIDELRQANKIQQIDFTKLDNFKRSDLDPIVTRLLADAKITDYTVPYQMGTIGIMYKTSAEIETFLEDGGDLWEMFFNDVDGKDYSSIKRGMYTSSRDALGSALIHLGEDVNTEDELKLQAAVDLIKEAKFDKFAADDLKRDIANPKDGLQMALVYSGDYFEQLFLLEQAKKEGKDVNPDSIRFWTSSNSNVFIDGYVITAEAENLDNAYAFINYMLDTETNAANTDFIGYCSPYTPVYNMLLSNKYGYDYDYYHPAYPIHGEERLPQDELEQLQVYKYSPKHTELLQTYYNKIRA